MPGYLDFPLDDDDGELAAAAFAYLIGNVPGYVPRDGHLESWMIPALARMVAEARRVGSLVPIEIFRYFGRTLLGLEPVDPAYATVPTTWTMVDDLGYTIHAGTVAAFRVAGDELVGFQVVADVVIPPGQDATGAGAVEMQALAPGTAANELGPGAMNLVTALASVDSVVATEETAGGDDGESDDEYVDRLAEQLRLLTPRPILANDFAVLARTVPGVHRATALDNYNPADDTFGNERMVAVAAVDEAGAAIGAPVKAELAAYLEAQREVNFVVNVMDPTFTPVDVAFTYTTLDGYDSAEVGAAAEAAVAAFLSPAVWGGGLLSPPEWTNQTTVYFWEIVTVLNNVEGLDRLTALTVEGAGADVVLAGRAPLPQPGAIVGTAA